MHSLCAERLSLFQSVQYIHNLENSLSVLTHCQVCPNAHYVFCIIRNLRNIKLREFV